MSYADVEALPPLALFGGRLALGEVTLLVAPAKTGKGNLWSSVLSFITTGAPFPGETATREPRSAVIVSHEDNPNTATIWRLRANGCDTARVFDVSTDENGNPFELPRDIGLLREAVDATAAQVVILDPYTTISSASMTVKGARSVIGPLQRLARETGCAVVIIHHTRKDGTTAGSQGLIDACRCELRLARDAQCPDDRILSVARTNLSGQVPDVRFTFEGEGTDTVVEWLSRDDLTARANAWRKPEGPVRVLAALNANSRPMSAQEIALKTGIPYPTCRVILHRLVKGGQVDAVARNSYWAAA
jgi:AAA domain-containing protein/IclR-like helix-turn-helix domain-containing protein